MASGMLPKSQHWAGPSAPPQLTDLTSFSTSVKGNCIFSHKPCVSGEFSVDVLGYERAIVSMSVWNILSQQELIEYLLPCQADLWISLVEHESRSLGVLVRKASEKSCFLLCGRESTKHVFGGRCARLHIQCASYRCCFLYLWWNEARRWGGWQKAQTFILQRFNKMELFWELTMEPKLTYPSQGITVMSYHSPNGTFLQLVKFKTLEKIK